MKSPVWSIIILSFSILMIVNGPLISISGSEIEDDPEIIGKIRIGGVTLPTIDEMGEWSDGFKPVLSSYGANIGLSNGEDMEIVVDPTPGSPMIPWIATTITTDLDILSISRASQATRKVPTPIGLKTLPKPSGHWELEDDYGTWERRTVYPTDQIRFDPIGYRMVDDEIKRIYSMWYTPFKLNGDGTTSVDEEPGLTIEYGPEMTGPTETRATGDASLVPGTLSISSNVEVPPEYLIITSKENMDEIQPLVDWRNRKGLATSLIDVDHILGNYSGSTDPADLMREYIKDVHYGWGRLRYVLLAGDWRTVPVKHVVDSDATNWDDGWIPADSYFQCLDGTWDLDGDDLFGEPGDIEDSIPDVIVSRLAIDDGDVWEAKVLQLIEYDSGKELEDWTDKGVLLGAHTHNEGDGSHFSDYLWEKYLQDTYSEKVPLYEDDGSLTNSAIENELLEGASFLQFVDHGGPNEWCDEYGAGVVYRSRDARGLTNGVKTPFISALACLTTWFDDSSGCPYGNWENCLGEAFTENPDGGAIGYVGSSRVSVGIINTNRYLPYDNGLIEDIARQVGGMGTYTTGDIHTGAKAHYAEVWGGQFSNENNPEVGLCWLEFTLLGEPACDVWTGPGDQIIADIEHEDDLDPHITITVMDSNNAPIEGANVSLQNFERGVFHRAVSDSEGKAIFDLILDWFCDINLTITKHNLKPFSGSVRISDVIPPVTTMVTDPTIPDGENGWFVTDPIVRLAPNERALVHYRIGTGPDQVLNGSNNYTIPSIPEGDVRIHFFAVDEAANLEVEQHVSIRTDLKDPGLDVRITPDEPDGTNGWYTSEPLITILEDIDDMGSPVHHECTIDGVSFEYTSPLYIEEGEHTISIISTDEAGRRSNSTTFEIKVDMNPPSTDMVLKPEIPDGENGWYKTNPTVSLIPSEPFCEIEYRLTQTGPFIPCTDDIVLPDGRYYLEYRSKDRSGNVEDTSRNLFMVDTKDPVLEQRLTPMEPDGKDGFYRTSPKLIFQWTDDHETSIMVSMDGEEWTNWTGSQRIPDGIHTIEAYAEDGAGRTSKIITMEIKVDTTDPLTVIEEAGLLSNGWFTTIPTLSLHSDEEVETYYKWSNQREFNPYSEPISPPIEEGTIHLQVYSIDRAGNTGPERYITYKVDIIKPEPMVSYRIDDGKLLADASNSRDGTDLTYRFHLDGVMVQDWSPDSELDIEIDPGPHQLMVEIRDSGGNTATSTISINGPGSNLILFIIIALSIIGISVIMISLLLRRKRFDHLQILDSQYESNNLYQRNDVVVAEIEEMD